MVGWPQPFPIPREVLDTKGWAALRPALLLAGMVGQALTQFLPPCQGVALASGILGPGSHDTSRHAHNKRQLSTFLVALISLKG